MCGTENEWRSREDGGDLVYILHETSQLIPIGFLLEKQKEIGFGIGLRFVGYRYSWSRKFLTLMGNGYLRKRKTMIVR